MILVAQNIGLTVKRFPALYFLEHLTVRVQHCSDARLPSLITLVEIR
jgi:hypothetical protein